MPTVELPATTVLVPAPGNGSADVTAALSAVDASGSTPGSTLLNAAEWFSFFQSWTEVLTYGDGPDLLNWTPPSGAAVTAVDYVLRAYREASFPDPGDATSAAAAAAFGSVPASLPAVVMRNPSRGPGGYFPDLTVTTSWGDVTSVILIDPDPAAAAAGEPMSQFTAVESETLVAVVKCDYLAVRITYEGGLPQRLYPRSDDRGAVPSPRNYPTTPTRNYPLQP